MIIKQYCTCNVTCGEGFKPWTRECNNPVSKYGEINCSHLGEPVEYTGHVQQNLVLVSQFFINKKIRNTKGPLNFLGIFYYYLQLTMDTATGF